MPELPEVAAIQRQLMDAVVNCQVVCCRPVDDDRVFCGVSADEITGHVQGRIIERVSRCVFVFPCCFSVANN